MLISKINRTLSTVNFTLCFVGYQFATTLLLPTSSDIEGISRTITVPYRAFALLVSLLVIMINFRRPISNFPIALKALLFFWGILIIRIFYDVFIRTDIQLSNTSQLWIYMFGICIPAIISIIKSYKYINLKKAFYLILGLTALTLVISIFSNQNMLVSSDQLEERQNANMALNTISFGQMGVTGIILALYALIKKKLNRFQNIIAILIILTGLFCTLRAGSRGPLVSLLGVMIFWLFSARKNPWGLAIVFSLSLFAILFSDSILDLIGNVAPVMEVRLKQTIYASDTNGRDPLFVGALNAFLDNPVFGKQFAFFNSDGSYIYSHNIILDALMGLGIIGGGAMLYFLGASFRKSYYLIKKKDPHFWICLVLIQLIISGMMSSCFYFDQLLSALLTFLFLYSTHKRIHLRYKFFHQNKLLNYASKSNKKNLKRFKNSII